MKLQYADRVKNLSTEILEILKLTRKPEIISFAGGVPNPDSFPIEGIQRIAVNVLENHGKQALQYGPTQGLESLRKSIAKRMNELGVKCGEDEIIITSGSQQALDLIGRVFLNPGDLVIVESPTYLGALLAFNGYQAKYMSIPMDEEGMKTDELERELAESRRQGKPKFLYSNPTFHNPLGTVMTLERRRHLIEVSGSYGLPIVEDDAYRELTYSGEPAPPLKSLDREGLVLYVNTFSKTLSPGFRLGWITASEEMIEKLSLVKQGVDLHTNIFVQYLADEYLRSGMIDEQLVKIRRIYRRKRDVMLEAIEESFPREAEWSRPDGGLFLWITLPESVDTKEMLYEAIKEGVAYVYGAAFFADEDGSNALRLSFSNMEDERIREGVRRLARILRKRLRS